MMKHTSTGCKPALAVKIDLLTIMDYNQLQDNMFKFVTFLFLFCNLVRNASGQIDSLKYPNCTNRDYKINDAYVYISQQLINAKRIESYKVDLKNFKTDTVITYNIYGPNTKMKEQYSTLNGEEVERFYYSYEGSDAEIVKGIQYDYTYKVKSKYELIVKSTDEGKLVNWRLGDSLYKYNVPKAQKRQTHSRDTTFISSGYKTMDCYFDSLNIRKRTYISPKGYATRIVYEILGDSLPPIQEQNLYYVNDKFRSMVVTNGKGEKMYSIELLPSWNTYDTITVEEFVKEDNWDYYIKSYYLKGRILRHELQRYSFNSRDPLTFVIQNYDSIGRLISYRIRYRKEQQQTYNDLSPWLEDITFYYYE